MKFYVLHPESLRLELMEFKDEFDMAEKEFEHKELMCDWKGETLLGNIADFSSMNNHELCMLCQPTAMETYAKYQDMQQNVCLDGTSTGMPGVFMDGEFFFGTVAFARVSEENGKMNVVSVKEDDLKDIEVFLEECMVVNGTRHRRMEAISEEMENKPVTVLQVNRDGIKELSVQGKESLRMMMDIRSHITPEQDDFAKDGCTYTFVKTEGIPVMRFNDKEYGEGSVLVKTDGREYVQMNMEEKQKLKKELFEGLIYKKQTNLVFEDEKVKRNKERT